MWCFTDVYPARIEVDCRMLTPNMSIKIGDVEKTLPYGMYLHKQYDHQKFHSVMSLTPTNVYVSRKNAIIEQRDLIKEQRNKMRFDLLMKRDQVNARKASGGKPELPRAVWSSKLIEKEKKNQKIVDDDGTIITMDELLARSKEGVSQKRK